MNKNSVVRITLFSALLALALIAAGCNTKPEMPNDAAIQTLVKTTTSELADALNTGNFKVMRAKASNDFQMSVSEEKLIETFKTYAERKDTTVPLLREAAGKDAKFSPAPTMREEKGSYVLVTNGTFALTDEFFKEAKFENEYVWRDGAWKLLKISYEIN